MAIGMTPEEFYDGPAWLCRAYRDAHRRRRELEDAKAYIDGAYTFIAVSRAISNAFGKKGDRPAQWLDAPLLSPHRDPDKRIADESSSAPTAAMAAFQAFAAAHNADVRAKGGPEG